ncbi:hypothetical protein SAMN05444141_103156 [Pseudovibrio denitrificans]|uniref:Uncharacterized protein n=2 Tax=Pseudovibrio TaxID=258255 RepID=A0A1I7AKN0_9HYPH|nr:MULTISPECIES: hypothetical protein [Pseudovibrio]QUS55707.1 hypothetical protein KGB56_20815 [Pseudovibrio brasiliensis]SFT75463.1 hypothetical protein SAMN05444141_103156 [Pseudovibrio denitrificans]
MRTIPLTLIPFLLYNAVAFRWFEDLEPVLDQGYNVTPWAAVLINIPLPSGLVVPLDVATVLLAASLVLLFIEIIKATRTSTLSLVDHSLSLLILVAYLIEFLSVQEAATPLFLLLMTITFLDVIAGFIITLSGARRDVVVASGNS